MSVDPRCYVLAVAFLSEVKGATAEDKTELAEQIQQTIEGFIASLESDLALEAKGASPS